MIYLNKKIGDKADKLFNLNILKKILPIAIPSIIQASIISFGCASGFSARYASAYLLY